MATGVVAVLPAKRLDDAKSRLAGTLSGAERMRLSLEMLRAVASRLQAEPRLMAWAIVSAAPEALTLAAELGGEAIAEETEGLNVALGLGRVWAMARNAESLLILPSDVPLIQPADLTAILDASATADVVIAPAKDEGTNALLLRPPDAIPFRFGQRSAAYHRFEATRRGLTVEFVRTPSLAFDVDTPADYAEYQARSEPCHQLAAT